jgi:hypothetical protein
MSGALAARLGALNVLDDDGRALSLGQAWESRPAVLAFVRHFG